jgi:CBS domain-containing protein
MKHSKIGSLMTSDVISVNAETPFKDVARLLAEHGISGVPVVDSDEQVIGVISETDLMLRQAQAPAPGETRRRFRHWSRGGRAAKGKSHARTAGRLMTSPAVTVHAEDSIAVAARTMARHRVERLPVVDEEGRLVGIVTRRDLLQVFLRPDSAIRREVIEEVLVRSLWLSSNAIGVSVLDGVVTLKGELERRSEIPVAVGMARQVDGVVAVVDELTYRFDDSDLRPADQTLHGVADDWLRRL